MTWIMQISRKLNEFLSDVALILSFKKQQVYAFDNEN